MGKILILGGAGFIGGNLARSLVQAGADVRIFTRPTASISRLQDILPRVEVVYGDFLDDAALARVVRGSDIVFHLISTTFPNTVTSSTYDIFSNLLPTIRLVELCLNHNVRKLIYASSGGTIYGEPLQVPIPEDHPLIPKSAYGQSKLTLENYLNFYARSTPLEVAILRISNPFGPGQHSWRVQGIVAVAIGCLLRQQPLKLYGTGSAVRDYIYISDVVDAMILAAQQPGSSIANISSGQGHSVLEIVEKIESIAGRTIVKEFIAERPNDVEVNILDNRRARDLYGWVPRCSLHAGLATTLEFMQRSEFSVT